MNERKQREGGNRELGMDVKVLQNRNWVGFNVRDFAERAICI